MPEDTSTGLTPARERTAAPITSRRRAAASRRRARRGLGERPISRDLATPMLGTSSSQPRWQARPKRRGWAKPWPSQSSRSGVVASAGQGVDGGRDLAKRQQARHVREARRAPRDALLDRHEIRQAQHRDRRPRDFACLLEPDVDAGDQRDRRRTGRRARPARPVPPAARGPRAGLRSQSCSVRRRQRHARRSRASSMMRTVSDHRPSRSTSASVNQRASAASLPGRSAAPARLGAEVDQRVVVAHAIAVALDHVDRGDDARRPRPRGRSPPAPRAVPPRPRSRRAPARRPAGSSGPGAAAGRGAPAARARHARPRRRRRPPAAADTRGSRSWLGQRLAQRYRNRVRTPV